MLLEFLALTIEQNKEVIYEEVEQVGVQLLKGVAFGLLL